MDDIARLPEAGDDWALFLDVDGTLVAIAETPDAVVADAGLVALLEALVRRFEGAIALVSGRPVAELDRLFAPLHLPAAGLHGHERRNAQGTLIRAPVSADAVAAARARLQALEDRLDGVMLEDKGAALALHYRQAPEHEGEVVAAAREAAQASDGGLELLEGKKVAELRHPGVNKGDVVRAFMTEAPFAGRVPVFVGDDVTDEDGFRAVNAMDGVSIRIGERGTSVARHAVADVAGLRHWLRRLAEGAVDA